MLFIYLRRMELSTAAASACGFLMKSVEFAMNCSLVKISFRQLSFAQWNKLRSIVNFIVHRHMCALMRILPATILLFIDDYNSFFSSVDLRTITLPTVEHSSWT